MPEGNPEQDERVVSDATKLYERFVSEPVGEIDGEPWPNPSLALRVAAKGALFMHGYEPESTDDVVEMTKKSYLMICNLKEKTTKRV